jgi:putative component of toxin-antitoxin plasmid stabilization module
MYYVQRGGVVIVLLGGGDTTSQPADIARAVKIAETIEE